MQQKGRAAKLDQGRRGVGLGFYLLLSHPRVMKHSGKYMHLSDLGIVTERTAPPPSRYIDLKLSEEGAGGGTTLPEPAR